MSSVVFSSAGKTAVAATKYRIRVFEVMDLSCKETALRFRCRWRLCGVISGAHMC